MKIDRSEGQEVLEVLVALRNLGNPALDADNPFYKSKYVSLPALMEHIRPTLEEHQAIIVQGCDVTANREVVCETMIIHIPSGSWITNHMPVKPTKEDAQGYGAAASYARRYGLLALCWMVGEEDDDGNYGVNGGKARAQTGSATGSPSLPPRDELPKPDYNRPAPPPPAASPAPPARPAPPSQCISPKQAKLLFAVLHTDVPRDDKAMGDYLKAELKHRLSQRGISHTNQIPRSMFDEILAELPNFNPACKQKIDEMLEANRRYRAEHGRGGR